MLVRGVRPEFALGDGDVFQVCRARTRATICRAREIVDDPAGRGLLRQHHDDLRKNRADNIHSPDMAHEQMPPVFAWSYKYVAAALPPQAGVATRCSAPPGWLSIWRLHRWGKPITHRYRRSVGTRRSIHEPRLGAGEVLELIADRRLRRVPRRDPLLMTQGIDCEPSLSLAISVDGTDGRPLDDLTFAVLPSFDQIVAVARRGEPVRREHSTATVTSTIRCSRPRAAATRSRASRCRRARRASRSAPIGSRALRDDHAGNGRARRATR